MNLMQRQSLHQWTSPSSLSYSPLSEQRHVLPVANDQEYDQPVTAYEHKKLKMSMNNTLDYTTCIFNLPHGSPRMRRGDKSHPPSLHYL